MMADLVWSLGKKFRDIYHLQLGSYLQDCTDERLQVSFVILSSNYKHLIVTMHAIDLAGSKKQYTKFCTCDRKMHLVCISVQ